MIALDFLVDRSEEIVQNQAIVQTNPFDQTRVCNFARQGIAQGTFVVAVATSATRSFRCNLQHPMAFPPGRSPDPAPLPTNPSVYIRS